MQSVATECQKLTVRLLVYFLLLAADCSVTFSILQSIINFDTTKKSNKTVHRATSCQAWCGGGMNLKDSNSAQDLKMRSLLRLRELHVKF